MTAPRQALDLAAVAPEEIILDDLERCLIDAYQHGFPLTPRPYAALAEALGTSEDAVLAALARLDAKGVLDRVGAVVAPGRAGASTLAAMAVPTARLDAVAEMVSGYEAVNHNYARDHPVNLWFVVVAADRGAVDTVLDDIAQRSGLTVFDLPLERAYHIDLGFALS